MSVEAIAAVGTQLATTTPAVAQPALLTPAADSGALASMTDLLGSMQAQPGDSLFDRLVDSLGEIDSGMKRSREATTEIALGQTDHLHQVLIDAERTRLQFDLAMSMRNRVLEAYQEIMRMQV
jgi:flagellar hook-basal body complex protein FliE